MEPDAQTRTIIGAAMRVHRVLGPGFLESVYQHALAVELRDVGLTVDCARRLTVHYRGVAVGEFVAHMVVDGGVVIENKAVRAIAAAHEAQLVHYLTATGIDVGLLLNFGAARLQFKRKMRVYRPSAGDGVGKAF